jgi:gliding motility-associated protein GldE
LAILLVLIILSASTSGAETSLFSLSPKDVRTIRERRSRSDKAILKLLSMEDYMLATVLVFNNFVNIFIVILSNDIIDSIVTITSTGWSFAVKTVIVTFILLMFGEIIPKIFASHYPLRFASMVARPLLTVKHIFKPLSWILVQVVGERLNRRAARGKGNISMEELSDALEMTSDQSSEEKKMLSGIVDFVNTDVEEIMHPRLDITAINIESDYSTVKATIMDSGYSRIPVFRESIDNIEGVLYVKDMLPHLNEGNDFEWWKHLRPAYYIPSHKKINDLLAELQTNKIHLAIVVDEYGSTMGLLSLEDILEEIVGEITDESDKEQDFYTRTGENSYIFDGKTHIGDFIEVTGMDDHTFDDVQGQAETIAGLMLEVKRDFLKLGESITAHGVKFTVKAMEGRRIDKVRVELKIEN